MVFTALAAVVAAPRGPGLPFACLRLASVHVHKHGWSNRLIAGDSLPVMNSPLEQEGVAGKVRMIYIDPPNGIRYGSDLQPFVNKRDMKDGKDEDLTGEREQILAAPDCGLVPLGYRAAREKLVTMVQGAGLARKRI